MGIETAMLAAVVGSGVLAGAGAMKEGAAAEAAGRSQSNTLRAQADQEERRAGQERAMAQRRAEEKQIDTDRLMGRQRAVAAASGGGTGGSAAAIEAETAQEGAFQSDLQLWQGEEKAVGLEYQAGIDRGAAADKLAQGKAARKASYLKAGSQVLGSIGSAYTMGKGGGGGASSGAYYGASPSRGTGIS